MCRGSAASTCWWAGPRGCASALGPGGLSAMLGCMLAQCLLLLSLGQGGVVVANGCWGDPSCSSWPTGYLLQTLVAGMRCPSRGGAVLWFPAPAPELLSLPAELHLDMLRYVQCLWEMPSSSHEEPSPMAFEPVAQACVWHPLHGSAPLPPL